MSEAQVTEKLPFLGSLLKNEQDTQLLTSFGERGGTPPRSFEEVDRRIA